eukprot:CFRG2740T1
MMSSVDKHEAVAGASGGLEKGKWDSREIVRKVSTSVGDAVGHWFGVSDDAEVQKWKSRPTLIAHKEITEDSNKDVEHLDNFNVDGNDELDSKKEITKSGSFQMLREFGSRTMRNTAKTTLSLQTDDSLTLRDKVTNDIVQVSDDDYDDQDLGIIDTDTNRTVLNEMNEVDLQQNSERLSQLFMEQHLREVTGANNHKLPKRYAYAEWFAVEGTLRIENKLYQQELTIAPADMCRELVYPLPLRERPTQRNRQGAKLKRLNTKVQHTIDTLPKYFPWFNVASLIVMVVMMCVELGIFGGVAQIGIGTHLVSTNVTVFGRDLPFELNVLQQKNMWIGPDTFTLIELGAKFSPCMRRDPDVFTAIDNQNQKYANADPWSCCQLNDGTCSMTPETECTTFFFPGKSPLFLTRQTSCDMAANCTVINRPCCISIYGQCNMISESYCRALDGKWKEDIELCQDYDNCLDDVCEMGGLKDSQKPNQWWRYITPIFLHVGVLHLIFNCMFQLSVGIIIEMSCGWFRFALIFFISGIGGNLVSALFAPHTPQVGSSGALYGLLAVLVIELWQSWSILKHPGKESLKIGITVLMSLFIGTLPWVDNWAHLGGFLFGIFAAVLFLPYITFGKWDRRRKLALILISAPILLALIIAFFALFYDGVSDFCTFCNYFNCIPYTSTLCEDNNANWDGQYFDLSYAYP